MMIYQVPRVEENSLVIHMLDKDGLVQKTVSFTLVSKRSRSDRTPLATVLRQMRLRLSNALA